MAICVPYLLNTFKAKKQTPRRVHHTKTYQFLLSDVLKIFLDFFSSIEIQLLLFHYFGALLYSFLFPLLCSGNSNVPFHHEFHRCKTGTANEIVYPLPREYNNFYLAVSTSIRRFSRSRRENGFQYILKGLLASQGVFYIGESPYKHFILTIISSITNFPKESV